MRKNSILISIINNLDIKVEDKKISGEIHKIKWEDVIKVSNFLQHSFEKLFPDLKIDCSEFLGLSDDQTIAGIELSFNAQNVNLEELNEIINYLVRSILSPKKSKSKEKLASEEALPKELLDALEPIIDTFVESNTRRKITIPISIESSDIKITIGGDYRKPSRDKVYLENIEATGQIDILGKTTTKFTITNPNEKTITVFHDPKDFKELHLIQGNEEIAIFELKPIKENNKTEYMLKSIKRIAQN